MLTGKEKGTKSSQVINTLIIFWFTQLQFSLRAVFELFFRKTPFKGEFCVFAGTDEVLKFLSSFRFDFKTRRLNISTTFYHLRYTEDDILYLKKVMPACEEEFWSYLFALDCSKVRVYAMKQGEVLRPCFDFEMPIVLISIDRLFSLVSLS